MAKAYWINTFRAVVDEAKLASYVELAGPAIRAAGGRFLARGDAAYAYELGTTQRTTLIEFDSVDAAVRAYHSSAYQDALVALDGGAQRDIRIIEAVPDVTQAGSEATEAVPDVTDAVPDVTQAVQDVTGTSSTGDPKELAALAAQQLLQRFGIGGIDLAFVLGSGWSGAAESMGETVGVCPLAELPGFSPPVVRGHGGDLRIVTTTSGRVAAIFTGRTHFYEGRGVGPVVHGVRTAAAAGAQSIVLTNGCGGLNPDWQPGRTVLLRDHINLTGSTPLVGPTFIDMTHTYSARLRELALSVDPSLPEGVYVQFRGPQFETPAEVRMAGVLGGDLVGMSTTLEAIAAREAGMEVLGISLVTNLAAGISPTPLHHAEVLEAGEAAAPELRRLLSGLAGVL